MLVVTRPPRFAGGDLEITLPGSVQSATLHVIAALDPGATYDLSLGGAVTDTLTADSTGSVSGVASSGLLALVLHEGDLTGACCHWAGTCDVVAEEDCTGVWRGAGASCDPNPCLRHEQEEEWWLWYE